MKNIYPLDRRVTLQQQNETRGSVGEVLIEWGDVATIWAGFSARSGGESVQMGAVQSTKTRDWYIRYRAGVTAKMRLVDSDGTAWHIKTVDEIGRRLRLRLSCEAVNV